MNIYSIKAEENKPEKSPGLFFPLAFTTLNRNIQLYYC